MHIAGTEGVASDALRINTGAMAAAAAMAMIAALVGIHSTRRAAAYFAATPPFPDAPQEAGKIADDIRSAERAAGFAPDEAMFRERIGYLRLKQAETSHAAGDSASAKESWAAASSELGAALNLNPASPSAHWQRIVALERLGRRDEAHALAVRAARLLPAFPKLQFFLGKFFIERRNLARGLPADPESAAIAVGCFRNAATADLAFLDMALEFLSSPGVGSHELASVVPDKPEARLKYARFLARKGNWAEAARIEESYIAAGRDNADARIRAGEANAMNGDIAAAYEHFLAAVRGWVLGDGQIAANSSAFIRAGKIEDGLRFFITVDHMLDPEEVIPAAMAKGRMHFDLGHLADAEENLSKAALEGANPEAYYYLSMLSERIGDLYAAETNLKQAIRGRRDQAKYHHRLGMVYEKMKRVPDALRELKTASAMDTRNETYRAEAERLERKWREGR